MNIVHFTDSTTPAAMTRQLMKLRKPDATIVFEGEGKVPAETFVINKRFLGRIFNKKLLRKIAKEIPANAILHVWTANMLDLAADVAELTGAKLLLSVDHLSHNVDSIEHLPWDIGRYRANITVPTQRAMNELISLKADPARIFVLPPIADKINIPAETRTKLRSELNIADDDFLLVVPEEMRKWASHKMASWAHGILRNIDNHYKLVFPGSGPYEKSVRTFAATTGYCNDVTFTGNKYELSELIAAGDACLCCGEKDTGLCGLAMSMACGTAVIASTTPDHLEVCVDRENAMLATAASPAALSSAIMELSENPQLREKIAANAKETANKLFDRDTAAAKLDDIYKACK